MARRGSGDTSQGALSIRDLPASDPAELWPAQAYDRLLRDPSDGLAMLLLLLKSSRWVHRRCETVTFRDARTVARRVSVDFTVPALAPVIELNGAAPVRLIPLTLLRKKTLVHFDLQDEAGTALPLIGLRQTQALTETMLGAWTELLLDGAPVPPGERAELRRIIGAIASGTQEQLDWATARLAREPQPDTSEVRPRLYEDQCFGAVMNWMADNFILMVALNAEVGARRIVKFSYDEPLTLQYKLEHEPESTAPSHRQEQLPAALGVHATRIRFPAPAAENCHSYHFEVEAPPGLRITEATMLAGRPHDEKAPLSFDQVSGGFPRANLHVADVPNGSVSRAQIQLRVAREGWLSTALIASCSTALVLIVAWLTARRSGNDLDAARTVLLAVTGAVASLLVKPQEHRMTTRMLSAIRGVTITATALPFLATGLLVFAPTWPWTRHGILLLAAIAAALASLVTRAWLRAGRGEDVTSPWEQGRRLGERSPRKAPSYGTYAEAERENGYDRPATIVASSEGRHEDEWRWDQTMERSMEKRLDQAVRIVRESARGTLLRT